MIRGIINKDGGEYVTDESGNICYPKISYRISDQDVVDNGNGSFNIPGIQYARDSFTAMTRETATLYVYDEEKRAWWKW